MDKMASHTSTTAVQSRISFPVALVITFVMAVAYTALDAWQPVEPLLSLLAFIPGGASLLALSAAGITPGQLNLRLARISSSGLVALGAVTLLLLPILGSSTGWTGWQWLPALVYAPASGIAQELYFRSSLLPGLEGCFGGRKIAALLVHAAIFVGFHFRTFQTIPSIAMAALVATVLFLAGCGWGWQVQRDRTVVWAMIQHSLFLVLMSMFNWT
jgi:hypothetical protein